MRHEQNYRVSDSYRQKEPQEETENVEFSVTESEMRKKRRIKPEH